VSESIVRTSRVAHPCRRARPCRPPVPSRSSVSPTRAVALVRVVRTRPSPAPCCAPGVRRQGQARRGEQASRLEHPRAGLGWRVPGPTHRYPLGHALGRTRPHAAAVTGARRKIDAVSVAHASSTLRRALASMAMLHLHTTQRLLRLLQRPHPRRRMPSRRAGPTPPLLQGMRPVNLSRDAARHRRHRARRRRRLYVASLAAAGKPSGPYWPHGPDSRRRTGRVGCSRPRRC
jgi:hypothetical protein